MGDNRNLNLPPGFRFYPSDEELIVHFLHRKATVLPCNPNVIPDLDLSPYDPWDLDGKAMSEGRKWYFYSRRTAASCRITRSGYWQLMGVEEPIYSNCRKKLIGTKKYYNFYINGSSHHGISTNWIMQEYTVVLDSSSSRSSRKRSSKTDRSTWVVCRVYEDDGDDDERELSSLDEVFLSLDNLDEISLPN